jgi:hypothetical protein
MASPDANGGESSLAEKMRQQHAEVPRPTVEDAPEDDAADFAGPSAGNAGGSSASWGRPASSIAPSKEKSTAGPDVALDTQSHELFPELGAPKSKANMGAVPTWAAKGPSNKPVNGGSQVNGSSRVSAPATTRAAVPAMTIPGRNVESITIHPQHILPREKLRRPIPDIIKDINRKSRANIAMVPLGNGKLKFDATGPQDVAQQALKDLVQQIGVKVCVPCLFSYTKFADQGIDHRFCVHPAIRESTHYWKTRINDQGSSGEDWCSHHVPQNRRESTQSRRR